MFVKVMKEILVNCTSDEAYNIGVRCPFCQTIMQDDGVVGFSNGQDWFEHQVCPKCNSSAALPLRDNLEE